MDYCARESTLNPCEEVREVSIKMNIQETFKILCEMNAALDEFNQIISGRTTEQKGPARDASSLWEESKMVASLAYENLHKLIEIKGKII